MSWRFPYEVPTIDQFRLEERTTLLETSNSSSYRLNYVATEDVAEFLQRVAADIVGMAYDHFPHDADFDDLEVEDEVQ